MQVNKSLVIALCALGVLGAAIGWRMLGQDTAPETQDIAAETGSTLTEQLRADAEADPDDPVKWQELGFALYNDGAFAEAADAYGKATEADPDSAVLWSAKAEALAMASNDDPLPPAALEAFEKAIALDASEPRARYYLAVKKDLDEDHEGAIADWLALLADTPPGAPWETNLVRTIQQVGAINNIAVEDRIAEAAGTRNLLPPEALAQGAVQQRGPTQEQMAQAAALTPSQQQEMAEGMVGRLAARLDSEGGSADEWIMLMRSYQQLGRTGEARRTKDRAIAANPEAEEQILQAAQMLGIG